VLCYQIFIQSEKILRNQGQLCLLLSLFLSASAEDSQGQKDLNLFERSS